jgi:hypothetical protein
LHTKTVSSKLLTWCVAGGPAQSGPCWAVIGSIVPPFWSREWIDTSQSGDENGVGTLGAPLNGSRKVLVALSAGTAAGAEGAAPAEAGTSAAPSKASAARARRV